jgi:hypothetical protein
LHDYEGVSGLHEPCLNLFDVAFPVVPDCLHPGIIVVARAPANDVSRVAFDPFDDLIILDVESPGDVSLDEPSADPAITVSILVVTWHLRLTDQKQLQ